MPEGARTEMTLPDAAQALRKSWQQTYRLVLTGQLDARRVGGRYVVSAASVERVRRAQKPNAGAGAAY